MMTVEDQGPWKLSAEEVERVWPLSAVEVRGCSSNVPRRWVFRIETAEGTFAAKLDGSDTAGFIARSGDVVRYLNGRQFPHAPRLLPHRQGRSSSSTTAGEVVVLEWVPAPIAEAKNDPRCWRDLASVVGQLRGLVDCRRSFAIPVDLALRELRERARDRPMESEVVALLGALDSLRGISPDALVHGEVNPDNARRRDTGEVVLIAWDVAGVGAGVLDAGYPLITAFLSESDHTLDDASATAWYHTLREHGGAHEPDAIFDAALFHALRYMWWGDTVERWDRIRFAVDHKAELCAVIAG